jgi:hypothetical protein
MPHRQTVIPALDSLLSATVGENSASGIIRPLSKRGNLVNFIVERLGYGPHLPAVNSGPRQSFAANLTKFLSFRGNLVNFIVERLGYGPHLPAVNSGPCQSFAANLTTFLSFERGLFIWI